MKIDVISEKENPLLERKEVVVRISYKGATPKREEIRSKVAATLGADDDRLILDPLQQRYGASEAVAKVKIYSSKKRVGEIERPHIIRKNFPEGEAQKPEVKEEPAKEGGEEAEKEAVEKEAEKTGEEKPQEMKEKAPKAEEETVKEKEPEKEKPAKEAEKDKSGKKEG
ncbi:MAG: hypothetical protein D6733_06150 [Methanobacteriota archaeon]|nr:MAG: hypothetical protein D6733_06150 [Euryarchaeota archaeon]